MNGAYAVSSSFLPTEKQIDQRASDKQPVRVLLQSSVAHFTNPNFSFIT